LSPPVLNTVTDDPVNSTSKSVFGQAILHLTSRLNLTGGIRYTKDDKNYLFDRHFPDGTVDPSLTGTTGQFSGDHVDYRAVVDYRWNESLMTYAEFSTGYKGGGTNPKPFIAAQVVPYNPETVDAYEVGFKSDFLDRRAQVNVAAFWNKYSNIILINANGAQGFPLSAEPFNAGDADIKGVEVESELHPVGGLTINASVSYLDFKYSRLSPDAIASSITLNNVPPLTPQWQASGEIAYEFDLGDHGSLTPRVNIRYTSDTYSDPANANFDAITTPGFMLLKAYTVADAGLVYETASHKWQASLEVTNLANRVYYTNGFAFWQSGTGQRAIAAPREVSFKVRRRFL
jgi:iron complex outermembrane recepter protein